MHLRGFSAWLLQLLFSADFTKSLEQDWQSGQFVCLHCKVSLTGQRYILHDDRPYCKKCYEDLFANICDKCKTPITCDFKVHTMHSIVLLSQSNFKRNLNPSSDHYLNRASSSNNNNNNEIICIAPVPCRGRKNRRCIRVEKSMTVIMKP